MQPSRSPLPDFDGRHEMYSSGDPVSREQRIEAQQLQRQEPGVRVEFDAITGTPTRIAATSGFLTGTNGVGRTISLTNANRFPTDDPNRATKSFLLQHRLLFGHGPEVLEGARVKREFVTPHNGLKTIVWEQQADGIPLFESVLIAHVTRRGELVNLSSRFLADPESAADRGVANRAARIAAPDISARHAVAIAAGNIGAETSEDAILADSDSALSAGVGSEKRQRFKAATLAGAAEVKLVWLPVAKDRLRLCWDVVLTALGHGEMYRVLVDVQTGQPLLRRCLTDFISDATFHVFTSDSPSPFSPGLSDPGTDQPPLVARSLLTLSALDTNASPSGWIDDGVNETLGNNVDAHADWNADNLPDLPRPQGSPFRVFDFPQDLNQTPGTYKDASVTQLFYWCNWIHDRFYELGFTEAAGNFQNDNFGRGGLGGDAVQADAQDGSGINNANFSTPPDGTPGRMQMYRFTGPNPPRDGDLDAEIVIHEYTHGLSNRRVGGGIGIYESQTAGMGEGWSDFYALSLLSEAADDANGVYAFGGYASFLLSGLNQNYYFGIRRYPYCTDLAKNPLTFKDIDWTQASSHPGVPRNLIVGGSADEVHNMGEVWCITLWEARAGLINKYGGAAGNQLMLKLVTDGMNLAPPNPNFLQARDAILQADEVNTDGANRDVLWAAFAKRGMGIDAVCPRSSTTVGVQESFDVPDDLRIRSPGQLIFSSPADGPLNRTCYECWLQNIGSNTLTWVGYKTGGWFEISPRMGTLAPGASNAVTICLTETANWLVTTNNAASVNFSNATSGFSHARDVSLILTPPWAFILPLETDPGWQREGQWEFGPPAGVGGSQNGHPDPVAGATGTNVFGVNLAGDYSTGEGEVSYLTAGPFDLSGYTGTHLQFQRWLNTDYQPFVYATVQVSSDGTNWSEIWNNGQSEIADDAWTPVSYDLSAFADNGTNVFVRWGHQVATRLAFAYSGWNIDDVGFTGNPAHTLALSLPSDCTEGDAPLPGRVAVSPVPEADLTVTLTSSDVSAATVPDSIIIPAGQSNATFAVTIIDDGRWTGTRSVFIKASAARHGSSSRELQVSDNETATLTVVLPATTVKGQGAVTGTVQLNGLAAYDTEITLASTDTNRLQVPPSTLVPSGHDQATFAAVIVDDRQIEGPQSVGVAAHAENWGDGSAEITILDDLDLVLNVPSNIWKNAGVLAGVGAVKISGTLQTNLEITLSSSDAGRLVVPSMVTIAAGQTEGWFDLAPVENWIQDGDFVVTITASAPGFADGAGLVTIMDDNTPPAPSSPVPADGETGASQEITLEWDPGSLPGHVITNDIYFGTTPAPGESELLGATTYRSWRLPVLAAQTTYYWHVVAHQIGTASGPVWHFTTRGPDHFSWEPISSPQYVSLPFTVSLTARDPYENIVTNFSGTVGFNLGGDPIRPGFIGGNVMGGILWPTNSGHFVDGRWSGSISIFQPASNVTLEADDGAGHSGLSNPFNMILTNDLSISGAGSPDPVASGAGLTYTLVVSNSGTADATGVFVTNVLPAAALFVSAESSQGVCVESNGILVCDLGVVSGTTNAILTITVVPQEPGIVLTNSAKVSRAEPDSYLDNNSIEIATVVEMSPAIVLQPSSQIVLVNGTASFLVVADGSEPFRYQWRFNGANLPDATNALLVLTNAQFSDAGSYAVLVANAVGSVLSSNALLDVQTPMVAPTITTQPTNLTVSVGATAGFLVSADGSRPLIYQWNFNDTNLPGATNALLTLTNIQLSDAGFYAALVTNVAGAILSSNALLTVQPPASAPSILMQPEDQTVLIGGKATFSVVVDGANPLRYQWSVNGSNLPGATKSKLTLLKVELSDAGFYAVRVTNAAGSQLSSNAVLTVQGPSFAPTILSNPTNVTVAAGGDASFLVVANGSEPLSYQWHFNGTNLPGATNALLALTNVQSGEAGFYAALVTNVAGSKLSSNALLTVEVPTFAPTITTQPTGTVVSIGDTTSFWIVAGGSEPLAYQWIFNATNLPDATNALLVLTNVQPGDAGDYAVLVTNVAGAILSSNALLTISAPDHFAWDAIPSPRIVNVPFFVTIQAEDASNGPETNFNGRVDIRSGNGIPVSPVETGKFVRGVWGGFVVVSETAQNLVLIADDGFGHAGIANPVNIIAAPTLTAERLGNSIIISWPAEASGFTLECSTTLAARDWVAVSAFVDSFAGAYQTRLRMSPTNYFYRLRLLNP